MRLLITGGGTGGHVYPLLAVLTELAAERAIVSPSDVRFVGRAGSIEERLAAGAGIPFVSLRVGGLRTLAPWMLGRNLLLMMQAVRKVSELIDSFKPQAVLATGGYVSAPAIYSSARSRVPVVIYLPDLEPGWAIRTLARWARCVAVSFPEVQAQFAQGKSVVTGYPVRPEFYRESRETGRAALGLNAAEPVVTIFGGSQGAHSINQAVRNHLAELVGLTQLVHMTGKQDEDWMTEARSGLSPELAARYHVFGYMDKEMAQSLAAADLVVSRAGAATLGELPAVGAPSILVPYPFAGKHQERNADFMVSHGAGVKLDDARLNTDLVPTIASLLRDHERLERMALMSRSLSQPHAARNIAQLLV